MTKSPMLAELSEGRLSKDKFNVIINAKAEDVCDLFNLEGGE